MTETNDQVTNQETTDNPEVVDVLGDLNEFNVQGSKESQDEVNEESLQETEQAQEEKEPARFFINICSTPYFFIDI